MQHIYSLVVSNATALKEFTTKILVLNETNLMKNLMFSKRARSEHIKFEESNWETKGNIKLKRKSYLEVALQWRQIWKRIPMCHMIGSKKRSKRA